MNKPLQAFFAMLKPDKVEIYQIYVYAVFKGLISLSLPLGIQSIINFIQGGQVSASWIVLTLIVAVGIAFSGVLQFSQIRLNENIQQNLFARTAFDFADRLPRIKLEALYQHYAPELVNRFFDTISLQKGLSKILIDFTSASLQIIFGLILLSLYHPFFIGFSLGLVLLILIIIRFTALKGINTSLAESKYKYKTAGWLQDIARSRQTFRLLGSENFHIDKTDKHVVNYMEMRENHFKVLRLQFILLISFKVLITLALLLAGGMLVIDQQMNIGQFVAAEIIIILIIDSSEKLILSLENVYDVFTSVEKINQVSLLELDESDGNMVDDQLLSNDFKLKLDHVDFFYPGKNQPVLNNINLEIVKGTHLFICGSNGSGKSTLLKLIAGLYHPQQGYISINNLPLANYKNEVFYGQIGYLSSNDELFEGSILENITVGRKIEPKILQWALELSNCNTSLSGLPQGLDTLVDSTGFKLSRSFRSKILLARSIVGKPKLLMLENNLQEISLEQRMNIYNALTTDDVPWTLIAVSTHDIGLPPHSKLITVENGEIV